jgi:hypothetical protein
VEVEVRERVRSSGAVAQMTLANTKYWVYKNGNHNI